MKQRRTDTVCGNRVRAEVIRDPILVDCLQYKNTLYN